MNELMQHGLMPAMTLTAASERHNMMVEFTKTVMIPDLDYGTVPGVSKPCLFKAGAEKLCTLFGMTPTFQLIERVEDWTGKDHGGEMFFYYFYKCLLVRGGESVGEGDGSCNSFEKKYRYREGKRKCPQCGAEAIFQSKPPNDPGFYCWNKKGGCGAKFKGNDESITKQEIGVVPNPDIAEQVNTIQKMAQKRALIAATLIACNASAFYTQDVEDMRAIDVEYEEVPLVTQLEVAKAKVAELGGDPETVQPVQKRSHVRQPKPDKPKWESPDQQKRFINHCRERKAELHTLTGSDAAYYDVLKPYAHSTEVPDYDTAVAIADKLKARVAQEMAPPAAPTDNGITDDDLPAIISGKPEPEYITNLRKLESRMVNEYRAGGRFGDILGANGADSIDTVQTEVQAKAIAKTVEDWMKEQPAKGSQPMTLPAGVTKGFKK